MKNDNYLDIFQSQEKAIDHAMWLNFKYRLARIVSGVISHDTKWAVCEEITAKEMNTNFLDILPKDYVKISYDHIRHLRMDTKPLPHWEKLLGLFSTTDGELLRYIIAHKMPLDKFVKYELASRGYDKNNRWCGFDKSNEIWLK